MMDAKTIREAIFKEKVAASLKDGYPNYEPFGHGPITAEEALEGINKIRNSIVGLQTVNWSEHIYPLVALLDRCGQIGLDYPQNRANFGTLIERYEESIELLKTSPCMNGNSEWRLQVEAFLKRSGEDVDSR